VPRHRNKKPLTQQDFREEAAEYIWEQRQKRLRQLAADLPFAVRSPEHGFGIILKPVKRRGWWESEPHWYLVNYALGIECRVHEGEDGYNRFFTWKEIGEYIVDHERLRATIPWALRPRTLWGHIFKLWD
jgi:hypothetical protein